MHEVKVALIVVFYVVLLVLAVCNNLQRSLQVSERERILCCHQFWYQLKAHVQLLVSD